MRISLIHGSISDMDPFILIEIMKQHDVYLLLHIFNYYNMMLDFLFHFSVQ